MEGLTKATPAGPTQGTHRARRVSHDLPGRLFQVQVEVEGSGNIEFAWTQRQTSSGYRGMRSRRRNGWTRRVALELWRRKLHRQSKGSSQTQRATGAGKRARAQPIGERARCKLFDRGAIQGKVATTGSHAACAKELDDNEISEALQVKLVPAAMQRVEARAPCPQVDSALASLERAKAQVVKVQKALETAQARSTRRWTFLHQAKTAVRKAETRVQQVRAQHTRRSEDDDTQQVAELVAMSEHAEKTATDEQTRDLISKLRAGVRNSANRRSRSRSSISTFTEPMDVEGNGAGGPLTKWLTSKRVRIASSARVRTMACAQRSWRRRATQGQRRSSNAAPDGLGVTVPLRCNSVQLNRSAWDELTVERDGQARAHVRRHASELASAARQCAAGAAPAFSATAVVVACWSQRTGRCWQLGAETTSARLHCQIQWASACSVDDAPAPDLIFFG